MKKPLLFLCVSTSLVFGCGLLKKDKGKDDAPAASPSQPTPNDSADGSQSKGNHSESSVNGVVTSSSSSSTENKLPTKEQVRTYALTLKPQFSKIASDSAADLRSASGAPTMTYYQARTTRQLLSIVLDIKTYEKTGKSLGEFKSINASTDLALTGKDFSPLYQANEKGLIELMAVYSAAVNKSKFLSDLAKGTTQRANFVDITNDIPTAVFNAGLAIRDGVQAEQGLNVASFYDSRMSAYNNASMNIHKLWNAFNMRSDTALLMLEQVDAAKAKSLRSAASILFSSGLGGYQAAELWSKTEMDAYTSVLDFYTK